MPRKPFGEQCDPCEWDDDEFGINNNSVLTPVAANLRDCIRLLWEQHVYWTRMTIISIVFNLPDADATTKRLLRNAKDQENLFRPFYGRRIAAEFGRLITDHLTLAAALVKAAKEGDTRAAKVAEKRWYQNADEIAEFLNEINPYWPAAEMRKMWHTHLSLTKSEAVEMLNENYAKSISIFDQIERQALMMADTFADGLINQFPDRMRLASDEVLTPPEA